MDAALHEPWFLGEAALESGRSLILSKAVPQLQHKQALTLPMDLSTAVFAWDG